MNTLYTVMGAYGRASKYKTRTKVVTDWKAGKDFKIYGGPYCSIRDFKAGDSVKCIFGDRLQHVTFLYGENK